MKKIVILGVALLTISTVNAMYFRENKNVNKTQRQFYNRKGRERRLNDKPPIHTKTNEGRLKQADRLVARYLKINHHDSLTKSQEQHVLNVLGKKTICPPGPYQKTCGQISCTDTEVTCQCLTHKGTIKKTSHSVNLKPHQKLINNNGSLKAVRSQKQTRTDRKPHRNSNQLQPNYKPVSIGMKCNSGGTIPGKSYATSPCIDTTCKDACTKLGKGWSWAGGIEEQEYSKGKVTGRTCMCHYKKPMPKHHKQPMRKHHRKPTRAEMHNIATEINRGGLEIM